MRHFKVHQHGGNHANHTPALSQRGLGHLPHQANVGSAIHQADVARRQRTPSSAAAARYAGSEPLALAQNTATFRMEDEAMGEE